MTNRKIIQVAPVPTTTNSWEAVYALCHDGTLWRLEINGATNERLWEWQSMPPIPPTEGAGQP